MAFDQRRRDELEELGYTVFPQVYPQDLVERLRVAIDETALFRPDAVASYEANPFQGIFSIANIGPDVLCMGAARAAYKLLFGASVKE